MAAADTGPVAQATLSERELAILRLLASGHTIKSIAARIDCSESAVNERLRDARRKTGFGSSRELARALADQEIWDSKTDLPPARAPGDAVPPPGATGGPAVKGFLPMLIPLTIAAGAVLAISAPLFTPATVPGSAPRDAASHVIDPQTRAAAIASPLVGRWALDTARVPIAERPRAVTIEFAANDDLTWTMTVAITAADGSRVSGTATAHADGRPVAVAGTLPFLDTAAFRRPAAGTLVVTLGKAGVPVSTRVYAVSRDRRTMTETIVWPGKDMPGLETNVFERAR